MCAPGTVSCSGADRRARKFLGFYLQGGIVQAVMGLDRRGDPEDPKVDGELKAAVTLIRATGPPSIPRRRSMRTSISAGLARPPP